MDGPKEKEFTLLLEETNTSISDFFGERQESGHEPEKSQPQPDGKNTAAAPEENEIGIKSVGNGPNPALAPEVALRNVTVRKRFDKNNDEDGIHQNNNEMNILHDSSLFLAQNESIYLDLEGRKRVYKSPEGNMADNTFIQDGVLNLEAVSLQLRLAAEKIAERDGMIQTLTERFETALIEKERGESDARELADKIQNLELFLEKVLAERKKEEEFKLICPNCSLNGTGINSTQYKTLPSVEESSQTMVDDLEGSFEGIIQTNLTRTNLEYLKLTNFECIDEELSSEQQTTNNSTVEDLKLQIADLEKKLESNKGYLEELTNDRECEREEHLKVVKELEEKVEELRKDKDRLSQITYQQKAELEDNIVRLRDAADFEHELEKKCDKNEEELKSAVEKIYELREIIRDLEEQIDTATADVVALQGQNLALSEELQSQVARKEEEHETSIITQESQQTDLTEEINAHIKDMHKRLEMKLKEMEGFDWMARPNSSCSGTISAISTEDVSVREVSALRRESLEEDRELGFIVSESLRRLDAHFESMVRFEDVLMKRLRDTELKLHASRKRTEELESDRALHLSKLQSQSGKIAELESSLETLRFKANSKLNAETLSQLKARVAHLTQELQATEEKLHLKNVQVGDLEYKLECNKGLLAEYYALKNAPKKPQFDSETQTKVKITQMSSVQTQVEIVGAPKRRGTQTEDLDLGWVEISSIQGEQGPTHSTPLEASNPKRRRRTEGDFSESIKGGERPISPEVGRDKREEELPLGQMEVKRDRTNKASVTFDKEEHIIPINDDYSSRDSLTSVKSAETVHSVQVKSTASKNVQTPPLSLEGLIAGLGGDERKRILEQLREDEEDITILEAKEVEITRLRLRIAELEEFLKQQIQALPIPETPDLSCELPSEKSLDLAKINEILQLSSKLEDDTNTLLHLTEKEEKALNALQEGKSSSKVSQSVGVSISERSTDFIDWDAMERAQAERLRGISKQIEGETLRTQLQQVHFFLGKEKERVKELEDQLASMRKEFSESHWESLLNGERNRALELTQQLNIKAGEMDRLRKLKSTLEGELMGALESKEKLESELEAARVQLQVISRATPSAGIEAQLANAQRRGEKYCELYMRYKSHRKALAWQKKYLCIVVEGYKEILSISGGGFHRPGLLQKEICLSPSALGSCDLRSPKTRFRIAVRAVMSALRFKFMISRWQSKLSYNKVNTRPWTPASAHQSLPPSSVGAPARLKGRRISSGGLSDIEKDVEEAENYFHPAPSSLPFERGVESSSGDGREVGTVLSEYLERFERIEKDIGRTIRETPGSSRNSSRR